ncbi:hypothetical protein [Marinimicrobium alkaliphilum]|uniref:hypothetical protein n=1 Tax=Marinimicrobium alkaliphilum TaxID=2202654 RepID=UPI000DB8FC5F|nr:hypothetical protein [Marinimicrobium alkaliphilum]
MLWHLIAAAFAGLGSAGVALLLRKLSRGRLPRWLVPAAAGLGILGYQVYYEYTWAEFRLAQLPTEAQLVESSAAPAFWRPWTHIFPMTTAFTVVDTGSIASTRIEGDKVVRFVAYHFERDAIERMHYQGYLLNCTTGERVPLSEQGRPSREELQRLPASSEWRRLLCSQTSPRG